MYMLKRSTIAVFLILLALELEAQVFPSEFWYRGEVKLKDGVVLEGLLNYDLERDMLEVEQNGRVQSFTASQVTSFVLGLHDNKSGKRLKEEMGQRYFYSFAMTKRTGIRREHFFELIVEGKATLLAREYVETLRNPMNKYRSRELRQKTLMVPPSGFSLASQILSHKNVFGRPGRPNSRTPQAAERNPGDVSRS